MGIYLSYYLFYFYFYLIFFAKASIGTNEHTDTQVGQFPEAVDEHVFLSKYPFYSQ